MKEYTYQFTGKLNNVCYEILSCVCFDDKKIVCKISSVDDIPKIKATINQIINEYDAEIITEDETSITIDNSYILFLTDEEFEESIFNNDEYTLIDCLRI